MTRRSVITRSRLVADLGALGLSAYDESVVMVHARMSALGWVVGDAQPSSRAPTDAIAPRGTLLVLTGWQDRPPYHQQDWDEQERRLYREEAPALDPRAFQIGDYAATDCSSAGMAWWSIAKAGYHARKVAANSPLSVRVRTCKSR